MVSRLLTLMRAQFPFGRWLLGAGALAGVCSGIVNFPVGVSTDQATAEGISFFLSITVGLWIGAELTQRYYHYLNQSLKVVRERIEAVEIRLAHLLVGRKLPRETGNRNGRLLADRVWVWCLVYPLPIFLELEPVLALYLFLRQEAHPIEFPFWQTLVVSVGVILAIFFMQHLYFRRMVRRVDDLEGRWESENSWSRLKRQAQHGRKLLNAIPSWFWRPASVPSAPVGQVR